MTRRRLVAAGSFMLVAVAARAASACRAFPQPPLPIVPLRLSTPAGPLVLQVELAATEEQRNCGLMGRTALPAGTGMLFDMRPAGPTWFWMKNTPLSLDLLFFEADGRLVHLERNAVPFSEAGIGTARPVAAVLELAAGEAARLGLGPGTRAALPWKAR